MKPSRDISRLIEIMAALRTPVTGCPWDLEQTFTSIAPYTIEEAYEVADAIARGDLGDLRDELGDLLLQVVYHAQIAQEAGQFAFADVVEAITTKLVRRHPHVFGNARNLSPDAVKALLSQIKASEKVERRAARAASGFIEPVPSVLDGVPLPLPALIRAEKISRKAASVGFDWSDTDDVVAKIHEELGEVEDALARGSTPDLQDEIGDLLFAVANLARHAGIDPEVALTGANAKFVRRFRHIETRLAAEVRCPGDASLDEMEALWRDAKIAERQVSPKAAE